jgi:hypothetical protein
MRAILNTFLILCLGLMLGATAAADELVTNGGFETGDFSGWNVSGYNEGSGITNDPMLVHSGSYAAWFRTMNDSQQVDLSQTLPTTSGTYDLVFWLKWVDFPPDQFAAYWNGTLVAEIGLRQSFPYQRLEIPNLPASGPSVLEFTFSSNVDNDQWSTWYLDDVSVTGASAPEPGTLMLLGTGVVGLAGVVRRRIS